MTGYLEARVYESCNIFEHDLLGPNNQILLDNTLDTNKYKIFLLHLTNFNIDICMYVNIKKICIYK